MVLQLDCCCEPSKIQTMTCFEKEFYLTIVRHGQTKANVLKVIQGHSNTPLSELGLKQVKLLGKYLTSDSNIKFNRIYTSDLDRAYQTCKIIIDSYRDKGETSEEKQKLDDQMQIKTDARLRERGYGPLVEGRLIENFQLEAYGKGFNSTNFTLYTPEGAESMDEVVRRVTEFCYKTLFEECEQGDDVLVVSHWGTIKEFLKIFQPYTNGAITKEHFVETPNVAMSRFRVKCIYLNQKPLSASNLSPSAASSTDIERTDSKVETPKLDVEIIYLHHTPHLGSEQISVCWEKQVE